MFFVLVELKIFTYIINEIKNNEKIKTRNKIFELAFFNSS